MPSFEYMVKGKREHHPSGTGMKPHMEAKYRLMSNARSLELKKIFNEGLPGRFSCFAEEKKDKDA